MAISTIDGIYLSLLALLGLLGLGALYYIVFVARSWLTRLLLFLGAGTLLYLLLAIITFALIAYANSHSGAA